MTKFEQVRPEELKFDVYTPLLSTIGRRSRYCAQTGIFGNIWAINPLRNCYANY